MSNCRCLSRRYSQPIATQAAPAASETAGRCVHGCTHRYEMLQQIGTQVHRQAEKVEKDPTQPAHPCTILTALGTPLSTQSPRLGVTVLGTLLKVQFLDEKGDLVPPAHHLQKVTLRQVAQETTYVPGNNGNKWACKKEVLHDCQLLQQLRGERKNTSNIQYLKAKPST